MLARVTSPGLKINDLPIRPTSGWIGFEFDGFMQITRSSTRETEARCTSDLTGRIIAEQT